MRNPLRNIRVARHQFEVAVFGGLAEARQSPHPGKGKGPLGGDTKILAQAVYLRAQPFNGRIFHLKNYRIFYRFYKQGGRGAGDIAVKIADKPVLQGNLHGVVLALVVNKIRTESPFYHLVAVATHKAGLVDKLPLAHLRDADNRRDGLGFFGGEVHIAPDIGQERGVVFQKRGISIQKYQENA